jgi:hypothetical protein
MNTTYFSITLEQNNKIKYLDFSEYQANRLINTWSLNFNLKYLSDDYDTMLGLYNSFAERIQVGRLQLNVYRLEYDYVLKGLTKA